AHRGEEGWIGGMGVKKEHRRKGVGSALLERCVKEARVLGLRRVLLEVIVGNEGAYALYRDRGFKEFRTLACYKRTWKEGGGANVGGGLEGGSEGDGAGGMGARRGEEGGDDGRGGGDDDEGGVDVGGGGVAIDITPVELGSLEPLYKKEHCWQKRYETIRHMRELKAYRLEKGEEKGYALFLRREEKLEVVDVRPAEWLGSVLDEVVEGAMEVRTINVYDSRLKATYEALGFEEFLRQREMEYEL
ncbi:MAG: GNAT family N-acetyltransferase, partial [Thermoplasmata archaeon]|nr:GNAT family N-acetyltransferase [Thermoplasmata archaeon]